MLHEELRHKCALNSLQGVVQQASTDIVTKEGEVLRGVEAAEYLLRLSYGEAGVSFAEMREILEAVPTFFSEFDSTAPPGLRTGRDTFLAALEILEGEQS